jgi:hypothetical protein
MESEKDLFNILMSKNSSHWVIAVIIFVAFCLYATLIPPVLVENSIKDASDNGTATVAWTKLSSIATYIYMLITFVTLLVVAGAATLAYKQLNLMNRNQKMQDALNLFNEIKKADRLESTRNLYEAFCTDKKFKLPLKDIENKGVQLRHIEYVVHTYEQMGAFAYEGLIDKKFVVNLITGACVRLWIVLEEYIKLERDRRHYPHLFAKFENLAPSGRTLLISDAPDTSPTTPSYQQFCQR